MLPSLQCCSSVTDMLEGILISSGPGTRGGAGWCCRGGGSLEQRRSRWVNNVRGWTCRCETWTEDSDTCTSYSLFLCIMGGMPSHSILVRRDKITARHMKNFTHTHTHSLAHCHTFITHFCVQTRIIHNFMSALRSTYRVQTQQAAFSAAGRVHAARVGARVRFRADLWPLGASDRKWRSNTQDTFRLVLKVPLVNMSAQTYDVTNSIQHLLILPPIIISTCELIGFIIDLLLKCVSRNHWQCQRPDSLLISLL